jgi:hypothetical protein
MSEEQKNDTCRDDDPIRLAQFDFDVDVPSSSELAARSTCEQFLTPNWDEYRWSNVEHPGQVAHYQSSDIERRICSARSKDELMKISIALALATLELAEAELVDRLSEIYLEATTEIVADCRCDSG